MRNSSGNWGRQLREADIRGLSDPTLYLVRESEFVERALPHPKIRLIRMLEALERYLAISDLATYEQALATINASINEPTLTGAEIILSDDELPLPEVEISLTDERRPTIRLENLPQLSKVRKKLKILIGQLDDPIPNPEPDQGPDQSPKKGSDEDTGSYPQPGA